MRAASVAALALTTIAVAGCASGGQSAGSSDERESGSALPATQPYAAVAPDHSAYVVWPAGGTWVLLESANGFRTVENRSPIAIDTDGGLVGDFSASTRAVAVGTTGRLLRSPLLVERASAAWVPTELPGGISDSRGAVAVRPGTPGPQYSAVTANARGTVVVPRGNGWTTLTTGRRLDARDRLTIDGLRWLDTRRVVVVGHGTAGTPVADISENGGRSWRAVPSVPPDADAGLVPCGAGAVWYLPVLTARGTEIVLRTTDGGLTWSAGKPFQASTGEPAWDCAGDSVETAAGGPRGSVVLSSSDGGRTWQPRGTPPAGLTSLAIDGTGRGFATTGGTDPALWAVRNGGRRFIRIRLPGWVNSLGQAGGTS